LCMFAQSSWLASSTFANAEDTNNKNKVHQEESSSEADALEATGTTPEEIRARLQHHMEAELNKILSAKNALGEGIEGNGEKQKLELKFDLPADLAELVNSEGRTALNIRHLGRKEDNVAILTALNEADGFAGSSTISSTISYDYEVSLCPLGHISTKKVPCEPCPEGTTTLYRGSSSCEVVTEEDLLGMFYGLMNGEKWSEQQRRGWKSHLPACDWEGVSCDLNGEINGMAFPLIGLKTEEDINNWHMSE